MARDTSTDGIAKDLIQRYVDILSTLAGWGTKTDSSRAVYPLLSIPYVQEPFPLGLIYLASVTHDWGLIHQGIRTDFYTTNIRIIGGAVSPSTRIPSGVMTGEIPELACYRMISGVTSELDYRPFLNDPTTGEAFRYVDPNATQIVGNVSRITAFNFGDAGNYIGIEIPTTVGLRIKVGRLS